MYKLLCVVLISVVVVHYAESTINRDNFRNHFRQCGIICAVEDIRQRNNVQKCLYFPARDLTVTTCVGQCMQKRNETLTEAQECVCLNKRCVQVPTTVEPSTAEATISDTTSYAPDSTVSSSQISTSSSTTDIPTGTDPSDSQTTAASQETTPVSSVTPDDNGDPEELRFKQNELE